MADDSLTPEERAELEQLRAEKAERERRSQAARERAELEQLKAERARADKDAREDARIAEAKARGRALMEPDEDDEDIRMPAGQKMVLVAIVAIAAVLVLMTVLGG